MKNLPIDSNSRPIQCAPFGNGYNFESQVLPGDISGLVRFKNIGEGNAIIRYTQSSSDGVVLSPGETEYFFINGIIEIVQGSVNVMY